MKILFLLLIILMASCEADHPYEIKQLLGQNLPNEATKIQYMQVTASLDYVKPYNVFIKFKIDSAGFFKFIEKLNLISKNEDYLDVMCMRNVEQSFISRIWSFERNRYFNMSLDKGINWWNPVTKDLLLYASFYSESSSAKMIHCYKQKWDGRVLVGYNNKDCIAYILVEVLM